MLKVLKLLIFVKMGYPQIGKNAHSLNLSNNFNTIFA